MIEIPSGQILYGNAYAPFSGSFLSTGQIDSWSASGLPSGFEIDKNTGEVTGTAIRVQNYPLTIVAKKHLSLSQIAGGCLGITTSGDLAQWAHAGGELFFSELPAHANLVSADHNVVANAAGQVFCFNCNTPLAGISGVTKVRSGFNHYLGLKSDGSVVAWGAFDELEIVRESMLGVPSTAVNVIDVCAGRYHSLALKSDGTVVAWGVNTFGQTSVPEGLSSVVAIAAGQNLSFALKSNGDVIIWGKYEGATVSGDILAQNISRIFAGDLGGSEAFILINEDGSGYAKAIQAFTGLNFSAVGIDDFVCPKSHDYGNNTYNPNYTDFLILSGGVLETLIGREYPQYASAAEEATQQATLSILGGTPIIKPGQVLTGKIGALFIERVQLEDKFNRPADSWSATGLPPGLGINENTGDIIGISPEIAGEWNISVTATGPGGNDTESLSIIIEVGAPIISPDQSFNGKVGDSFNATPSLDDEANRPAESWTATGLPAGLSLNISTGEINGTPTAKGFFVSSLRATGPGGVGNATGITFTIAEGAPIISPAQTGSGKVGTAFSKTFTLTDSINRPATEWSAEGLPSWASLDSVTGAITGTPEDVETATITLTATGPGGSDTETATISIAIGVPIITAGQTFAGKVGDAFSANISLDDALDRPATAWAATGLPAGLLINSSTGAITGAPATIGSFTASIAASNGAGIGASQSVGFTIEAGAPVVAPNQSLSGTVGLAFSSGIALTNSANRPATSYTFTGLPAWAATNSSTGLITGTPTATGTTTFSVTATGPGGTSEATNVSLVISASGGGGGGGGGTTTTRFMLAPNQTFTASLGVPFEATPVLLQGTVDTWYASGLPGWATINPTTGEITGTPTFSGVTAFNLSAIDSENNYSSAQATLAVTAWNVREIFVDVRERKILSVANSRYPLSKITLKRDDKIPFRIIFVDEETPFSIPESFSVSVGLKKNFNDEEYLAFSPDISGTLDLSSEPIQELFLGGAESSTGFFEVKWEDATSAFRTVKLPAEIQNSVIRGNDYTAAAYFGADAGSTTASTSAEVRAISAPIFGPAKGNSYTIPISPGDTRVTIAYPSALGDLASVRYAQFNNAEVLDTFVKTTVEVSASGSSATTYSVYTYTAGIPFEDFATYTVTI
jgi:hypothetical protein